MATVYITRELISQVKRRVDKMRDNEIHQTVPENENRIEVDSSQLLMEMAWGEYLPTFSLLPEAWLVKDKTPCFNLMAPNEAGDQEKLFSFDFVNQMSYYAPPTAERWSAPRPSCTKEWLEAHTHLQGCNEVLERLGQKEVRRDITQRWGKVASDIELFLGKCKSLNEGLRLWPALKMYVPDEYIERVETKVERRKRVADLVETVNIEELTAAAIAAKLSGAV